MPPADDFVGDGGELAGDGFGAWLGSVVVGAAERLEAAQPASPLLNRPLAPRASERCRNNLRSGMKLSQDVRSIHNGSFISDTTHIIL
jgi:hypothetical protein